MKMKTNLSTAGTAASGNILARTTRHTRQCGIERGKPGRAGPTHTVIRVRGRLEGGLVRTAVGQGQAKSVASIRRQHRFVLLGSTGRVVQT